MRTLSKSKNISMHGSTVVNSGRKIKAVKKVNNFVVAYGDAKPCSANFFVAYEWAFMP
jgi:hypothetical protein